MYAPDLFLADALQFMTDNKTKPFFLYYATTAPHANNEKTRTTGEGNEVPSDAPYSNENWPQAEKNKAAMITRWTRTSASCSRSSRNSDWSGIRS